MAYGITPMRGNEFLAQFHQHYYNNDNVLGWLFENKGERVEFDDVRLVLRSTNLSLTRFNTKVGTGFLRYLQTIHDDINTNIDTIKALATPRVVFKETPSVGVAGENKRVAMKTKAEIEDDTLMFTKSVAMMRRVLETSGKVVERERLFIEECVRFVEWASYGLNFTRHPVDFFFYLKGVVGQCTIITIAYAIYDALFSFAAVLRVKKRVRQIVERKRQKRQKRPKYFAIVFGDAPIQFTNAYVSEVLLRLVEASVLRCSSLSKLFLVTQHEAVFYKYCLIGGKVCLKAMRDRAVVRI